MQHKKLSRTQTLPHKKDSHRSFEFGFEIFVQEIRPLKRKISKKFHNERETVDSSNATQIKIQETTQQDLNPENLHKSFKLRINSQRNSELSFKISICSRNLSFFAIN